MTTKRETVPAAEDLLNREVKVLDHGFVTLTNYMGSDAEICRAARTCTSGENTKTTSDDRALIRRLMRDRHTSPFEFVEFTFLCQMPIFVARQWIRHRTANVNEMSGRYGELPELTYIPEPEQIAYQNPLNKQGRGGNVSESTAEQVRFALGKGASEAFDVYHSLLGTIRPVEQTTFLEPDMYAEIQVNGGISRELARINLPLSTYTKWMWKIDLHNLLHFLELRLHPHAQWEIRQYAQVMAEAVQALCPLTWQAFEDFRLDAVTLSGAEVLSLRRLAENRDGPAPVLPAMSKSEYKQFVEHLNALGLDFLGVGKE